MDNGEEGVGWVEFPWAIAGTELVGMSFVVFKDESSEFELSSMTSKVGQDGDDDGDC